MYVHQIILSALSFVQICKSFVSKLKPCISSPRFPVTSVGKGGGGKERGVLCRQVTSTKSVNCVNVAWRSISPTWQFDKIDFGLGDWVVLTLNHRVKQRICHEAKWATVLKHGGVVAVEQSSEFVLGKYILIVLIVCVGVKWQSRCKGDVFGDSGTTMYPSTTFHQIH